MGLASIGRRDDDNERVHIVDGGGESLPYQQQKCLRGEHEADPDAKLIVRSRDADSAGSYLYIEWRGTRAQRGLSLCRHCRCIYPAKES